MWCVMAGMASAETGPRSPFFSSHLVLAVWALSVCTSKASMPGSCCRALPSPAPAYLLLVACSRNFLEAVGWWGPLPLPSADPRYSRCSAENGECEGPMEGLRLAQGLGLAPLVLNVASEFASAGALIPRPGEGACAPRHRILSSRVAGNVWLHRTHRPHCTPAGVARWP